MSIDETTKSKSEFKGRFQSQKWLIFISVFIGVVTIALLYQNKGIINIFQNFIYVSLPLFLLYIAISLTIQIFLVIRWKIIIKTCGHSVPFTKLWIYKTIAYSLNYFTPTAHVGGEPMRALLLKRYNVSFPKAFSTVLIDKSMEMAMNSFFAILGIFFIMITIAIQRNYIYLVIGLSILLMIVLLTYYKLFETGIFLNLFFDKVRKLKFLRKYVREITTIRNNIYQFHNKNKLEFNISATISVILWVLMFFEFKIALLMLGYSATITELFLIITVVGIAYTIPVPAALGVLEFSQIYIFGYLGIDVTKGFALSFLIRSRDTIISLIGMMFLFYKSFKFKTLFEKQKKRLFKK